MQRKIKFEQLRMLDVLLKSFMEFAVSKEWPQFVVKLNNRLVSCDFLEFENCEAVVSSYAGRYAPNPISHKAFLGTGTTQELINKSLRGLESPVFKTINNNIPTLMELLLKDSLVEELPTKVLNQPHSCLFNVLDLLSGQKFTCFYVDPEQVFEVVSIVKHPMPKE